LWFVNETTPVTNVIFKVFTFVKKSLAKLKLNLYFCRRNFTMEIINLENLAANYQSQKETALFGKWIHYKHISPVLSKLSDNLEVSIIGESEQNTPIHSVRFGTGPKRILLWTQMHGNESTGTKAIFDFFNCIAHSNDAIYKRILKECTVLCVPMLNPDGSFNYTRVNANNVDLNRDAVVKKAKESRLLRRVLDEFNPLFCFNLHDQRTIFGVEETLNPATISFLAPSEEKTRMLTKGRKETMNVIIAMNSLLQKVIPNHIGRYTDEFYPTATGDNFQKLGYNTILIEAGHYPDDYDREETRKFNFYAIVQGIYHIATTNDFTNYESYFEIPNNQKNFFDIIENGNKGYLYVDKIIDGKFTTEKKLEKEGDLSDFIGHSVNP